MLTLQVKQGHQAVYLAAMDILPTHLVRLQAELPIIRTLEPIIRTYPSPSFVQKTFHSTFRNPSVLTCHSIRVIL